MFILELSKSIIIKRYKCQWYAYNGKRRYIEKTSILHANNLDDVKNKAILQYGSIPDNILRV